MARPALSYSRFLKYRYRNYGLREEIVREGGSRELQGLCFLSRFCLCAASKMTYRQVVATVKLGYESCMIGICFSYVPVGRWEFNFDIFTLLD